MTTHSESASTNEAFVPCTMSVPGHSPIVMGAYQAMCFAFQHLLLDLPVMTRRAEVDIRMDDLGRLAKVVMDKLAEEKAMIVRVQEEERDSRLAQVRAWRQSRQAIASCVAAPPMIMAPMQPQHCLSIDDGQRLEPQSLMW